MHRSMEGKNRTYAVTFFKVHLTLPDMILIVQILNHTKIVQPKWSFYI